MVTFLGKELDKFTAITFFIGGFLWGLFIYKLVVLGLW